MANLSFTVFQADCIGNAANCLYPHKATVADEGSFRASVAKDHVFAEYAGNYRSVANFVKSDALTVDCDNDHSDNPADWVQPADVAAAFKNVMFAVHFSRHHMKVKNGKSARPKFHVVFPIEPVTSADDYAAMKAKAQEIFPYFDTKALDAARFFFGTPEPEVEFHEGSITLTQFLTDYGRSESDEAFDAEIPEGTRNTTLSRFAGRTLKRYGDTEEAYTRFLDEAQKCAVPLPEEELQTIWRSAEGFFHSKVEPQEDYISPEVYNSASATLRPDDYSDVGQAEVLASEYGGELRYSPATDYIRYNGVLWQESKPRAQAAAQELTTRQLHEVRLLTYQMWQLVEATGGGDIIAEKGIKKAKLLFTEEQTKAYADYADACNYSAFVVKHRESKLMSAMFCSKTARASLWPSHRTMTRISLYGRSNTPIPAWFSAATTRQWRTARGASSTFPASRSPKGMSERYGLHQVPSAHWRRYGGYRQGADVRLAAEGQRQRHQYAVPGGICPAPLPPSCKKADEHKGISRLQGPLPVLLCTNPPYGYTKDPEDKSRWIVDEKAAEVVREIFHLCMSGYGPTKISNILEQRKIENPVAHGAKRGLTLPAKSTDDDPYVWHDSTISRLLTRQEYLGHTVNFKTYRKSYKNKKQLHNDASEWQIFENTHEAIIDQETFDIVQRIRNGRRHLTPMGEMPVLSGMLFCADCGNKL